MSFPAAGCPAKGKYIARRAALFYKRIVLTGSRGVQIDGSLLRIVLKVVHELTKY